VILSPLARFRIPISDALYIFIIIVPDSYLIFLSVYLDFLIAPHARGIGESQRITTDVEIEIPALRVFFGLIGERNISTREPPLCRRVVPREEVIQPRFNISFFLGELLANAVRCAISCNPCPPRTSTAPPHKACSRAEPLPRQSRPSLLACCSGGLL
jgi:hypothetical protein